MVTLRTFCRWGLSVLLVMAAAWPAWGADPALFTVRDIPLDVRASTASAARSRALETGERKALREMLQRLTLSEDWQRLPPADARLASSLVAAIEISEEKISAGRYQAKLTVEFDSDGIRALLRRADIPFSETRYKPVLILPVYVAGGLMSFIGQETPWRAAWAEAAADPGLIPYRLLTREEAARLPVSADTALSLPLPVIRDVQNRQGVINVVAVRAQLVQPPAGRLTLEISARNYQNLEPEPFFTALALGDGESMEDATKRAAGMIRRRLEDAWKAQTLAHFDRPGEVAVDVPLRSLSEWHRLMTRLEDNLLVDRVDIRSLASNHARLTLHFLGDIEQLRLSLAQADMVLEPRENGAAEPKAEPEDLDELWLLRPAARATGRP